ncbi:hypothetical protein PM082_013979 [Marasmius tenuissimus]|nr:hypothetical protein PM082_013979 [Marasmius tenuissimus]
MLQAWSVFHALGITLEDDLGNLQFTWPEWVSLGGELSQSRVTQRRQSRQPIYLFVHPLPANLPFDDNGCVDYHTSTLHYWSFQEDGKYSLSPHTCRHLGLPTTLKLYCHIESASWNNKAYKAIHQYQRLRGFNPTTTAFA